MDPEGNFIMSGWKLAQADLIIGAIPVGGKVARAAQIAAWTV